MNKCEGFLKENDEHSTGDAVVVELVVLHVCLLGKYERRVFKTYTNISY